MEQQANVVVRLLGPVELSIDGEGRRQELAPRAAALLVALAHAPGVPRALDQLTDEVYGMRPPPTAADSLQSHLSRLRRRLEPGRDAGAAPQVLVREPGGYRLDPAFVRTDAIDFEHQVAEGRGLADRRQLGDLDTSQQLSELLRGALRGWRGTFAQGLEVGPGSRAAGVRLEELRATAVEEALRAELDLGRHDEVAAELEALVAATPERERLHGLRLLALYRAGRQAEALNAYREARSALVEGLGVEPGTALRRLHQRILAQDPRLDLVDVPAPRLWRVPSAPDGQVPDTRVADGSLGHVPSAVSDLVGRHEDRREVVDLLAGHRLVTLTGAGGCGKTQLALTVAADLVPATPDGVWVVELGARQAADVVPAVADVLGVDDGPVARRLAALRARVAGRRAVLVLDDAERLVDPVAELVVDLCEAAPGLRVLVTSRRSLDVATERTWRVPSLGVPPSGAGLTELQRSDAGALLLRRAFEAQPALTLGPEQVAAMVAICRELDGIPLALELAGARMRVLAPEEIAGRLDDRFAVLRGGRRGAPERHRTLEAAIAGSVDLLDAPARRLLARLSVFRHSATAASAEAICSGGELASEQVLECLQDLADRSLIVTEPSPVGPARHRLLQSIRSYAIDRLLGDEGDRLGARHTAYVAGLADRAGREVDGPDQVTWLNRLHAEQPEFRAGLARCAQDPVDAHLAGRIVAGSWWFWLHFGHAQEGADRADQVVTALRAGSVPAVLAFAAGRLAAACQRWEAALEHLDAAAVRAAAEDDDVLAVRARARTAAAWSSWGDDGRAEDLLLQVRREVRALDDPIAAAVVADVEGQLAWGTGDLAGAEVAFARAEAAYLARGDRWSACGSRLGRARVARATRDLDAASAFHTENLEVARELTRWTLDYVGIARDLRGVAVIVATRGGCDLAGRLLGAAEDLRTDGEVPLAPAERHEVGTVRRLGTEQLGSEALEEAIRAGRTLGASRALDLALGAVADVRGRRR